jgi:hypothetical protein
MKRRDALRTAAAGFGAASIQAQTPASSAKPKSAPVPRKHLLFDDHQLETVAVLCDLIIPATDTPGARAARTHDFIDLLLNDGPAGRRNSFLAGLGWLDGYAIREHKAPFVRCSPSDQLAMLKTLDGEGSPELKPGNDFFRDVKGLTVMGYYTSREGIAELNKGGRVPRSFGCKSAGGSEA